MSSWGPNFSSQSHNDFTGDASGHDNFHSNDTWSHGFDANGLPANSSNFYNHVWGDRTESSSGSWSMLSVMQDPATGNTTTYSDGGGSGGPSNTTTYDTTTYTPGLSGGSVGVGPSGGNLWGAPPGAMPPPFSGGEAASNWGDLVAVVDPPPVTDVAPSRSRDWLEDMLDGALNSGQPSAAGSLPLYGTYFNPQAGAAMRVINNFSQNGLIGAWACGNVQNDIAAMNHGPSSQEGRSAGQALSQSGQFVEFGVNVSVSAPFAAAAAGVQPLRGGIPGIGRPPQLDFSSCPGLRTGGCFSGRMLIDVEGGKKRAKDIQVGDRVAARSQFDSTGPIEYKEVEEVFIRVTPILNVHVAGQVIETSPEHPFYVEGRGWIPAGMLQIGDVLLTREGEQVFVEGVGNSGRVETVYNWRIRDWHTYFVSAGERALSIWAHNANGPCNLHHSDPVFMGGERNQVRTRMTERQHQRLHRDLNSFLFEETDALGNHMRPQRGNSGADIRANFTRDARLDALARFYRQYQARYPNAFRDFFAQHPGL